MLGNLRLAVRLLAKSRGFTAIAILTLAVTVGVNSVIFSLIEGALLRPAVPHKPEEVVCISPAAAMRRERSVSSRTRSSCALREPNAVFAMSPRSTSTTSASDVRVELRRSFAFMVSDNFFRLMGAQPVAGRFFTAEETRPKPACVSSSPATPMAAAWRSRGFCRQHDRRQRTAAYCGRRFAGRLQRCHRAHRAGDLAAIRFVRRHDRGFR